MRCCVDVSSSYENGRRTVAQVMATSTWDLGKLFLSVPVIVSVGVGVFLALCFYIDRLLELDDIVPEMADDPTGNQTPTLPVPVDEIEDYPRTSSEEMELEECCRKASRTSSTEPEKAHERDQQLQLMALNPLYSWLMEEKILFEIYEKEGRSTCESTAHRSTRTPGRDLVTITPGNSDLSAGKSVDYTARELPSPAVSSENTGNGCQTTVTGSPSNDHKVSTEADGGLGRTEEHEDPIQGSSVMSTIERKIRAHDDDAGEIPVAGIEDGVFGCKGWDVKEVDVLTRRQCDVRDGKCKQCDVTNSECKQCDACDADDSRWRQCDVRNSGGRQRDACDTDDSRYGQCDIRNRGCRQCDVRNSGGRQRDACDTDDSGCRQCDVRNSGSKQRDAWDADDSGCRQCDARNSRCRQCDDACGANGSGYRYPGLQQQPAVCYEDDWVWHYFRLQNELDVERRVAESLTLQLARQTMDLQLAQKRNCYLEDCLKRLVVRELETSFSCERSFASPRCDGCCNCEQKDAQFASKIFCIALERAAEADSDAQVAESCTSMDQVECQVEKLGCHMKHGQCGMERRQCQMKSGRREIERCQTKPDNCQQKRGICQMTTHLCHTEQGQSQMEQKRCQLEHRQCQESRGQCLIEQGHCISEQELCQLEQKWCQTKQGLCQLEQKWCQTKQGLCQLEQKQRLKQLKAIQTEESSREMEPSRSQQEQIGVQTEPRFEEKSRQSKQNLNNRHLEHQTSTETFSDATKRNGDDGIGSDNQTHRTRNPSVKASRDRLNLVPRIPSHSSHYPRMSRLAWNQTERGTSNPYDPDD